MNIDVSTLFTALFACTAICAPIGAWLGKVLTKQKYQIEIDQLRTEVQKMQADVQEKLANVQSTEIDNVRKANDLLVESIVTPLKKEISSLRRDVDKFRKAVEKIPSCPMADNCPVSRQLQNSEDNDSRKDNEH